MKNVFFISSGILITSILLLFLCCSKNDLSDNLQETEADRFVASEAYQKLANENSRFAVKIYQALSALSPEEREDVTRLCNAIKEGGDYDQIIVLVEQLQALTGINYMEHVYKTQELSENLFKGQTFTQEEFVKAIWKYKFMHCNFTVQSKSSLDPIDPNTSDTTSVTVSPSDTTQQSVPSTDNAALLEACIQGCYNAYNIAEENCKQWHTHTSPEYIICSLERSAVLTDCIKKCKEQYPVTPSTTEPGEPTDPGETEITN